MPKSTAPRDDDEIRRKGSRTGASVFGLIVLGMVVTGLGGYGITEFGTQVDTAIKVGDTQVSAADYGRALQGQINQFSRQFGQQFTFQQAQLFGIDGQVLQSLVSNAALTNEAARIGISATDLAVAKVVAANDSFKGVDGKFDRATYERVLDQNGFKPAEFEQNIREDLARQVLQAAVASGQTAPEALTRALYAWAQEARGFTVLILTEANLPTPLPEATPDELQAWYDAHIDAFTRPEAKRVAYAVLRPADLVKDQTVAEADVKAAYDAAADTYNIPEKRLVERLVYPSDAEAQAAKAELDAGKSFDDLVKARGLDLDTVDMGDVTRTDLGPSADAVFALTEPGTLGPLPTDLGPALFRVNAILPAQITPYDEAGPKIREDLALKSAATAIAARNDAVDDLLAGGSSVEEVAKDQGMTAGTTDYAPEATDNDPVTEDPAFAKAVAEMEPGDFAQSLALEDGSLMVVQVTEALPAAPIPYDKALAAVTEAQKADALARALTTLADAQLASGARIETLGITTRVTSTLRSVVPGELPSEAVAKAFALKEGETAKIDENGVVALIRLDSVTQADLTSDAAKAGMTALAGQLEAGLANDLYGLTADTLAQDAGLTIDQAVINAVQSRM
ncbi:SurA N-terminal domain-containing protein [Rhodobacter sp. KR11]|uniref:peptidyl-prolyl cis-trans isomerase n=1 Tax=Rhodobacter sp. KR11 TaxID=2974588 RepID=UPI0022223CAC|nr:peptidyl-prolyl cis-trans isomerase [Rhodobacter sp. KR11]MCW1919884.1 SurA N-terminal domain-containing protein [Rhodobacter sp. KR11]